MDWKKIELTDTEYLIVPENPDDFTAIFDDEDEDTEVHLGIYIEQRDMREMFASWDNVEHHICPIAQIVVIDPLDDEVLREAMECMGIDEKPADPYVRAWIVAQYAGGVPLPTITLLETMEENNIDVPDWGEEGCFKCWKDADAFVDAVMKIAPLIAGLIGFILDNPVNLIGNTGWDIIRLVVENYDYIGATLRI